MHMVAMDDPTGTKRISDDYLATESGSKLQNKSSWEAYIEFNRIIFGKNGKPPVAT